MEQQSSWVSVCQVCSTNNTNSNFQTCSELVKSSKSKNVNLICFPECFAFMGEKTGDSLKISEPLDGPLFSKYRELANDVWISYGGFHETGPDSSHVYNSHIIVDNKGEIKAVYRKLHMFSLDLKNGPKLDEKLTVHPGKEMIVIKSPIGKLGLSTCYDVRFPELYSCLRQAGAEILLVPSSFTIPTGRDHWEVLMKARAIETQCYVVAAAQQGQHNPNRSSYGRSLVVDPWGTLSTCCSDTFPTFSIAEINLQHLQKVRESMPVFEHRRTEIYGRLNIENVVEK